MPKVLIFTPTWFTDDDHLAMRKECSDSVKMQVFSGQFTYSIGTENPFPIGQHRNVLHQYQKARDTFLAGDWDALLTLEHDNVLPDANALQRLWDTEGDVIYAPYQLRHGAFVLNTWQYINDSNLGMPLNHYPEELQAYRKAGVGRICGCGMGCTLFRRHVVEAVPFRGGDGAQWAPDIPFAEDALQAGFVSMGRFDVPVIHWDGDIALEPYRCVEKMSFLAVETVNVIADGHFIHLVSGEVYELTPREANELTRVGYVVSVEPDVEETAAIEVAVQKKRVKSKRL